MNYNKIATFLAVFALVFSGVGGPVAFTGTAAAATDQCDSYTDYVLDLLATTSPSMETCDITATESEINNMTAEDRHAHAVSAGETASAYRTAHSNFQQDTRTVAWTEAQMTAADELRNGTSRAEAKEIVNSTIEDYYSTKIRNEMERWNQLMAQAKYVEDATSNSRIYIYSGSNSAGTSWFPSKDYTLPNGENVTVQQYESASSYTLSPLPPSESSDWNDAYPYLSSKDPNDGSQVILADAREWKNLTVEYEDQSEQMKANAAKYIDGIYDQYNQSDLENETIVSPVTLADEAASGYNSTGYYSYAASTLAAAGYEGDLGTSMNVTVTDTVNNNTTTSTYDGIVMSSEPPENGSLEVNTTYDPENLNGTQYLVYQKSNNSSDIMPLEEKDSFTINSATDKSDGTQVTNVTYEEDVYRTYNASELETMLAELLEQREEHEVHVNNEGGGGGGSGDGGAPPRQLVIVGLAALTAGALWATRDRGRR